MSELSSFVDKVKSLYGQIRSINERVDEIYARARNKEYRSSTRNAEALLSQWRGFDVPICQRLVLDISLSKQMSDLESLLPGWREKIREVDSLLERGRGLELSCDSNPLDLQKLTEVLKVYQQAHALVNEPDIVAALDRAKSKIKQRQAFVGYVQEGERLEGEKQFKAALERYGRAKGIFHTEDIERKIMRCFELSQGEAKYKIQLDRSLRLAAGGDFTNAINTIETALGTFPRKDGQKLLARLRQVVSARDTFNRAMRAEGENKPEEAVRLYEEVTRTLPELKEANVRLAILAIERGDFDGAIKTLNNINSSEARYLRGFALAKQNKLTEAEKQWQFISYPQVREQAALLERLKNRERLATIRNIETCVAESRLFNAQAISLHYLNHFGEDKIVRTNLENHIQPLQEQSLWSGKNWQEIVKYCEQQWEGKQDINSLHNLAIASYYLATTKPDTLAYLIPPWLGCLANLDKDTSLQEPVWLAGRSIDKTAIHETLNKILDDIIDELKETNIENYQFLRDIYRIDKIAINLFKEDSKKGVEVKGLMITPGCYLRHRQIYSDVRLPYLPPATLYTNWGKAVAACMDGNVQRAIVIKPGGVNNDLERLAQSIVAYHEGCFYLQKLQWKKAIEPLKLAKKPIKETPQWQAELERLCEQQRLDIDNLDDGIQFAQFWFDVSGSQSSRQYLVEEKTKYIIHRLRLNIISDSQALSELKKLDSIDKNNKFLGETIETLEYIELWEPIRRLLLSNQIVEAINRTKYCRNTKVREEMALLLIDMVKEGLETRSISLELMGYFIDQAYSISPKNLTVKQYYESFHGMY